MQIDFLGKDARATCGLLPLGFAAGIRRHTIWNKVKESMMTYTSDRELQFARHNPSTCRSKNVIFISISTADYVVWTPSGRPLSLILSLLPLDAQGWANFGATWSVAVRFRNCCTHRPFQQPSLWKSQMPNKRESRYFDVHIFHLNYQIRLSVP